MCVTLEITRMRIRVYSHDQARDSANPCALLLLSSWYAQTGPGLDVPSLGSGALCEHMAKPGGPVARGATYRVVLLGELGVGKTSLFRRIKDNTFDHQQPATSGIDSCSKYINVDGEEIVVSEEAASRVLRACVRPSHCLHVAGCTLSYQSMAARVYSSVCPRRLVERGI